MLSKGRKYGLVGINGSGKSTLMQHIARREGPFKAIPGHFDIHMVEQEVFGTDQPALDCVIAADTERLALLEKCAQLEESDSDSAGLELARVYQRLKEIEADLAVPRASTILSGLQFTEEMKLKATKDFSGGWRMRISLARALFRRPTLLLLDEPTNHLDLNAVIWLDTYLTKWKNTLLIVSHDQDFMNNVCTDIIQVYDQQLIAYKGTYDNYKVETFLFELSF
jgi:ATP-binding cassette subfamily F protein 1